MLALYVRTFIIECITGQSYILHTCPSEKLLIEVNKPSIPY